MKKLPYFIMALALAACTDDIPVPAGSGNAPITDRPTVEIPLAIEIGDFDRSELVAIPDGKPGVARATAVEDTETGADATLHDIWIMQFECPEDGAAASDNDAVKDDALLVYWDYIPDYDPTVAEKHTAKFVVSSHPCFVIIFANTLDPDLGKRMSPELKFSDVKLWRDVISSQADLTPNDLIRFNGIEPLRSGINGTTPRMHIPVKRNIARIDISCIISDPLKAPGVDFTLDEITLCDIPDNSFFLTNGNWREDFTTGLPQLTKEDGSPELFPVNSTYKRIVFDDPMVTPAASLPAGIDYKARFYVPANQRGRYLIDENYSLEQFKSLSAPAYASFMKVKAHYTKNGECCPVVYTYYLGKDLGETDATGHDPDYKHDYNLIANHAYSYTLNFNTLPDVKHDLRVEDFGTVTFPDDELSNCYILNPPDMPGYTRRFNIPVARVDEFWGDSRLGDKLENCLGNSRSWVVDIVWTDFNVDDFNAGRPDGEKFEIVKSEGHGNTDFFTVEVPHGLVGNAVVGAKKNASDEEYLWSWHLWITDYNPDREFEAIPGTFIYPVEGGSVCHMDGDKWRTGDYKNVFMMDRCVGSHYTYEPENLYTHDVSQLCFVYNYGRKDPFTSQIYLKGNIFKKLTISSSRITHIGSQIDVLPLTNFTNDVEFINYTIAHPEIPVNYNGYTSKLKLTKYKSFLNGNYVFADPRIVNTGYPMNNKKSIFDPSPLGWVIPPSDILRSFLYSETEITNCSYSRPEDQPRGFPFYTRNLTDWLRFNESKRNKYYPGKVYWPDVDPWKEQIPEKPIYFPNFTITEYFTMSDLYVLYLYSFTNSRENAGSVLPIKICRHN